MCSRNSTIKCFFSSKDSIYSEPYVKLLSEEEETDLISTTSLSEIRIIFKSKIKLLKGINETTTFGDLKMAMLVSSKNHSSSKENYGVKKWCICESVNKVEKILTSDLLVQEEMKRVNQEKIMTNNEFQVIYIMRLKSNLQLLKSKVDDQNQASKKISILAEFCPRTSNKKARKNLSIQAALKKFDKHIEERKNLIKLLEDYYDALECFGESFDENKSKYLSSPSKELSSPYSQLENDRLYVISKLNVKDSDSFNSSFNSSNSSTKYETYV